MLRTGHQGSVKKGKPSITAFCRLHEKVRPGEGLRKINSVRALKNVGMTKCVLCLFVFFNEMQRSREVFFCNPDP